MDLELEREAPSFCCRCLLPLRRMPHLPRVAARMETADLDFSLAMKVEAGARRARPSYAAAWRTARGAVKAGDPGGGNPSVRARIVSRRPGRLSVRLPRRARRASPRAKSGDEPREHAEHGRQLDDERRRKRHLPDEKAHSGDGGVLDAEDGDRHHEQEHEQPGKFHRRKEVLWPARARIA